MSYHACHANRAPTAPPPGVALCTNNISTLVFPSGAHQQLVLTPSCLKPPFLNTVYSTCSSIAADLATHRSFDQAVCRDCGQANLLKGWLLPSEELTLPLSAAGQELGPQHWWAHKFQLHSITPILYDAICGCCIIGMAQTVLQQLYSSTCVSMMQRASSRRCSTYNTIQHKVFSHS